MNIREYIQTNTLYLDGGMGTLLQKSGLAPGERPETWNITHADTIIQLHRAYLAAGARLITANTFGANSLHFGAEELEAVIAAAMNNAKAAVADYPDAAVALDIGPTGRMLAPYGDLDFEEAVGIFAEVVRLGVRYGADAVLIETMTDSYETKAALLAAKEQCDLPVLVSNAYGADGKLMTGADPAAVVALLEGLGADAIGVNCSFGPEALTPVVEQYLRYSSVPVLFQPNAGLPRVINGETVYDVAPDEFATVVADLVSKGVRLVGGCCGTTPAHIAALVAATKDIAPLPLTDKNISCVSSYTHAVTFERPVLIGERINPTGKKKFKQALVENNIDYIRNEGLSQAERGVDILDVNVGLPEIDEVAMLRTAVCELQAICDLPLQIDTADPAAMETALRRYNGKAMVNSVSGKRESMEAVFPLVKKYGGLVVALTLDESGIPPTAEGRLSIAERILAVAEEYGIAQKDIIFDPLALTISADATAGRETLRALRLIRERLGAHTSLGVSNVSFGLPERDGINSTFFAMALSAGLSAAIMNPYSDAMMRAYHAYLAIAGLDDNCARYIAYATVHPVATAVSAAVSAAPSGETEEGSALVRAIVKGLRDEAARLTEAALATAEPMAVVQGDVIPALDRVGLAFEQNKLYLPQLLMSAEAARAAFEVIKSRMDRSAAGSRMPVVLATVKGDIHDIGKNIVKLLLENYGFAVCDLGSDVAPETVLAAARRTGAPLVGLSALMTTTVPAMAETVALLHREWPDCRVVVGGAVLTEEYAAMIGADRYAKDAMATVRYAEAVEKEMK